MNTRECTGLTRKVESLTERLCRRTRPLSNVRTQVEQIDQTLFQERLFAKLSSFFGLLALILACIGLYGIMSYSVARRTNETGIRMALGAKLEDILRTVLPARDPAKIRRSKIPSWTEVDRLVDLLSLEFWSSPESWNPGTVRTTGFCVPQTRNRAKPHCVERVTISCPDEESWRTAEILTQLPCLTR